METVPQIYIRDVKLTPEFDSGCVKVELEIAGEGVKEPEIRVSFQGNSLETVLTDLTSEEKKGTTGHLVYRIQLPEQEIHPWTPDHPDLYDMELTYGTDLYPYLFRHEKIPPREG